MTISKIYVENYKLLKKVCINVNAGLNVFVGENGAGKSTLLEVISIITSGKLNGYSFAKQIKDNMFNAEVRRLYIESLSSTPIAPPKIILEAYSDEVNAALQGTNNTLAENVAGIRVLVEFDNQYASAYQTMLSKKEIKDIPVEFYRVSFNYFSGDAVAYRLCPFKSVFVDTTRKDYSGVVDRFVSENITQYLSDGEQVDLSIAYRKVRDDFKSSDIVAKLNSQIKSNGAMNGRNVSIELREDDVDEWKRQMAVSVDAIPFEQTGFGLQNTIKVELAIENKAEQVSIILMEEPENCLSYSNMAKLVYRILTTEGKQIFISTHSSYIANRLNLGNLLLVNQGEVTSFQSLPDVTKKYFSKLPGYNTLRLVLAERVILVEGPTDDLIIQRAYKDKYGVLPIEKGIDVIAVDSLAFKHYCDIAIVLGKTIAIVTDNDGSIHDHIESKYADYLTQPNLHFFYEKDEKNHTIEPSVLAVNAISDELFNNFKSVISQNGSLVKRDYFGILEYMSKNKSEWAFRVFESELSIKYPAYIEELIDEYR